MTHVPPSAGEQQKWNQAYDRLVQFLRTFALGDHAQVSRLSLAFLDEARDIHRQNPRIEPTTAAIEVAQRHLSTWLAANLGEENTAPAHILPNGYIALLLSRLSRIAPEAFLASPLSDDLRQSLRQTLVVTGPDLTVSSMTPRHLDYGPMLGLARQTWHRWDARTFVIAILFWTAVYFFLYWWLSDLP